MKDIVKMYNTKQFTLTNAKDIYYLSNTQGVAILKMYLPQFIIQLDDNRFAVGSSTNNFNKKSFCIFNYDPVTGKLEKEFGCEYYGKDSDSKETILNNLNNMYCNNRFFLQGNNRVVIYDVATKQRIVLKNMPNSISLSAGEEGTTVTTTAKSQYDDNVTDQVEFLVKNEGLPITGFYSELQDEQVELMSEEEVAEILHKDVKSVTYEDVLNTTYIREVLYYLNNLSYTQRRGRR